MWIGFLVGTVCLIGLIKVLHAGRWRSHGWGGGCGHGRGGCGHGWHGDHGGRRAMIRWLFERLDTTPGQEKAILAALDDLRSQGHKAKTAVHATRPRIAGALRGELFDEAVIRQVFVDHDVALEGLREAAITAFAKIHDALDERQRKQLAGLVESFSGPSAWGHGPYRA